MRFRDTPRCDSDAQGPSEKPTFYIAKDALWRYEGEPTLKRDSDAQEPSEELLRYADTFSRQLQAVFRLIEVVNDTEFYENVESHKRKIEQKSCNIRNEICDLKDMSLLSLLGGALGKNSEKTPKEKILEAVSCGWLTVKDVCVLVYPWKNMSSREKELKLKSTRMCLFRFYGRKGKRGRPAGKLVYRIKTKDGFRHSTTREGRVLLQFLRNERIRSENNKAMNEQMKKIVTPVEELVLDIEQMQTYNAQAIKRLTYSAVPDYLYRTTSAMVKTLALQLVADRKEIIEGKSNSQIDSFVQGTNELLKLGTTEVSIFNNLHLALEAQKLAEDLHTRLRRPDN